MNTQILWVPYSVLTSTTHSASTRLVWLLLGRRRSGSLTTLTDTRLHTLSGLDAKTVATARARLAQAPLAPCHTTPHTSCAAIPMALLTSGHLTARARILYGQLQGAADFDGESGSFTYAALSRVTGNCDDALRRAVAELVAAGWLTVAQANRKSPLSFTLRDPVSTHVRARISSLRRRLRSAQHRGEALLREFLNLAVALDDYDDNAAPDWLLNPYTGEFMELDRYYPTVGAAVEFNGDQHYAKTDLATFEETVKQVGRDAMKAFICKAQGIELVILHPEDLRWTTMDQRLPGRLPRRDLAGLEPLLEALEAMAAEYRQRTAEERTRKGSPPKRGASLDL